MASGEAEAGSSAGPGRAGESGDSATPATARRRLVVQVKSVYEQMAAFVVRLPRDARIRDLKDRVSEQHWAAPPRAAQQIIFGGRVRADDDSLVAVLGSAGANVLGAEHDDELRPTVHLLLQSATLDAARAQGRAPAAPGVVADPPPPSPAIGSLPAAAATRVDAPERHVDGGSTAARSEPERQPAAAGAPTTDEDAGRAAAERVQAELDALLLRYRQLGGAAAAGTPPQAAAPHAPAASPSTPQGAYGAYAAPGALPFASPEAVMLAQQQQAAMAAATFHQAYSAGLYCYQQQQLAQQYAQYVQYHQMLAGGLPVPGPFQPQNSSAAADAAAERGTGVRERAVEGDARAEGAAEAPADARAEDEAAGGADAGEQRGARRFIQPGLILRIIVLVFILTQNADSDRVVIIAAIALVLYLHQVGALAALRSCLCGSRQRAAPARAGDGRADGLPAAPAGAEGEGRGRDAAAAPSAPRRGICRDSCAAMTALVLSVIPSWTPPEPLPHDMLEALRAGRPYPEAPEGAGVGADDAAAAAGQADAAVPNAADIAAN